jgi:hypothetical protein
MTIATAQNSKIKVIGTRQFMRNFTELRREAFKNNTIFQVESRDEPTLLVSTLQPTKKKYTIKDLMNFRVKLPKGHKVDRNLSQNIDKYVYGY